MSDGDLLLITRHGDPALAMLRAHAPRRVLLATIADLSRFGWRYELGKPYRLAACASGRVVRASEIAGVLCRVGAVTPSDLPHLHEEDRVYAAAEMNAFLHAWLMAFPGVRFNDPSWISLAGPSWHPLRWASLLEPLGIPVESSRRARDGAATQRVAVATMVGSRVLGVQEPELVDYTRRVAQAVRSELLSVTFVDDGRWKFLSADPRPRIDAVVAGALIERVFGRDGAALDSRCGAA
jgi:hypothetical protein